MFTVNDFKSYVIESIGAENIQKSETALNESIASAKDAIETFLNKNLEPTNYVQIPGSHGYVNGKYKYIPAKTPVIECECEVKGKDFLLYDSPQDQLEYRAGYIDLPMDIKRVWFNLVIYEWNRATGNTYNLSTKTVTSGSTVSEISKSAENFYADELQKISKHKDMLYSDLVYEVEDVEEDT
jgi:hypothetical protein